MLSANKMVTLSYGTMEGRVACVCVWGGGNTQEISGSMGVMAWNNYQLLYRALM